MNAKTRNARFAVCLRASPENDLELGKVYRIVPDAEADEAHCLRVIDESGEDYLYPSKWFVMVDVPKDVRQRLLKAFKGNAIR